MTFPIIALVFYVGALWLISGKYNTAQFFTVLTSVVSAMFGVPSFTTSRSEMSTDWYHWQIFASIQAGNVFTFVPDASKANGAAAAIFRLLDDVPEIDATSDEGIKLNPAEVKGHIRLEGVHFRYPSRPAVRVLRDLTINVPPGT